MHDLETNLRLGSGEKEAKVAPYEADDPTWWLVLVDDLSFALEGEDRDRFRRGLTWTHPWSRIVLLRPDGVGNAVVL